MLKIQAKIWSLTQSPCGRSKGGYIDLSSFVNSLPNDRGTLDSRIFSINVRGNTIDSHKMPRNGAPHKHKVYDGVVDTLSKIRDGASPDLMFLNNQGCLIMCESCVPIPGKKDFYEITFSMPHHGFGNGQQTIRSVFYSSYYLGIDLFPMTTIFAKITEGFDPEESVEICHNNNNSKSINNKDRISNTFSQSGLEEEMARRGYLLIAKKDFDKKNQDASAYPNGTINLHDITGFYNLLNAYKNETPWMSGSKIVDHDLVDGLDADTLETVYWAMRQIDSWIDNNESKILEHKPLMQEKHLGPYGLFRNLFMACYKQFSHGKLGGYCQDISIEDFFGLCLKSFANRAPGRDEKGVSSKSFILGVLAQLKDTLETEDRIRTLQRQLSRLKQGAEI